MGKNKWKQFYDSHSSLNISNPHKGAHDLQSDWERESAREGGTYINGKSLKAYAAYFNNFKKETDIEDFFKEVILKDMTCSDNAKDNIVDYLKTTFHQGGLQFPVTSALSELVTPDFTLNAPEKKINIITTPTGVKIQEFVSVKQVVMLNPDYIEELDVRGKPKEKLNPKPGVNIVKADPKSGMHLVNAEPPQEYIIQAQGTVNLDFSKFSKKNPPKIQVESNTIHYNNSTINHFMDAKLQKKGLGNFIVIFLKYALGLNTVKDLSPVPDSDTKEQNQILKTNKPF